MEERIHHAYLLVGDSSSAEEFLHTYWEERGTRLRGSPDFYIFKDELFGIAEARAITEYASRRAFKEKKVFLLAPERVTLEAQNALLKTFEDPYDDTHFFLCVREEELILPTLRSRMQTLHVKRAGLGSKAADFLKLPYAERLIFAKKFADKEENLSIFLDDLLMLLRQDNKDAVKRVYEMRRYSDDRSTSRRLVLEHLALAL